MSDCIKQIGLVVARLEISKMWKQSGPDDGKDTFRPYEKFRKN